MVEREADVRPGRLQHVAVAVRQDGEPVTGAAQPAERLQDVRKRLQRLDLRHQPLDIVQGIADAAAVLAVGHRPVADMAVRDRESVVWGKRVYVRENLGGSCIIETKNIIITIVSTKLII